MRTLGRQRMESFAVVTPEDVKTYIENGLECEHLEVSGDGQHFEAVIVCASFAGKRPIARHQLVYAALGDRMKGEIHALSMKTLTPDEWRRSPG
jgi:acid stress-induced BolA-like protein IbaG/YrbA